MLAGIDRGRSEHSSYRLQTGGSQTAGGRNGGRMRRRGRPEASAARIR